MDVIRKAGALIISGKKMLIVKEYGKSFFASPGGKYEENESSEECVRRELMEELGVAATKIKFYKTYKSTTPSGHPIIIDMHLVEIDGNPEPREEIETIEWLDKNDFKNGRFNLTKTFDMFIPDMIKDGLL
jgi:8-oxo-dGTP pyrophosphatase MutT (NUDIX family)